MKTKLLRVFLLLLLLGGIGLVALNREQFDIDAIREWFQHAGMLAPVVFMLVYIVATVLFFPGSVLTLLGGALFGPVLGTFYNLTAATLGAMLAFLVARYLASDWVAARAAGRLKQLINGVEQEGWRFVAFVRLVPLFPFNLLNYALGLTRINFWQYSLATWVCMLPGGLAYTYLGYLGREAATESEGLVQKALLGLALLALAIFLPRLVTALRTGPTLSVTELKTMLDRGEDVLLLDVRTAEDFNGEQGHVDAAVALPLAELEARIDDIAGYRDKTVATICRTDRMSAEAARKLTHHGFADVRVVKMGMTDWIGQGFPVERG